MNVARPSRFQWLLFFAVVGGLALFAIYPRLFDLVAISHFGVWFLDSFAILASSDAVARGLDPYLPNALDYFNRPHVYTHWWLHLHQLGLTRADNFWLGVTLGLAFMLTAISGLRPKSSRETWMYLAVLCSAPVLLAVNRTNNDLVVFILLAPVVPCLLDSRPFVRWLPVALIAVAAALKFYPAIAGIVLLGGTASSSSPRTERLRVALALCLLALVAFDLRADLARIPELAPKARGLMTFGAVHLTSALGLHGLPALLFGSAVVALSVVLFWRARGLAGWVIAPADERVWLSFVLGAALLTGCFFTGTNMTYRWIFGLWLIPLLWRLPRDESAPMAVRRLARITRALLLYAFWADVIVGALIRNFLSHVPAETLMRGANRFFALEQPVTWALFLCLVGFLTHFVRAGVRRLLKSDPVNLPPAQ